MLHALEECLPDGSLLFAKVLKNAPWSLRFYEKNGFREVDTKRRQQAEAIGMTQKPWSVLLYKQIEQAKEQETATDL
ncbi:MAG: GNAT family N-acetyltransferase [Lachnospiraceae bacterium]|nr:GNAT family N-acetyltransferase [Lachnospiraceae bacterium]